jgi:hypothetical protein
MVSLLSHCVINDTGQLVAIFFLQTLYLFSVGGRNDKVQATAKQQPYHGHLKEFLVKQDHTHRNAL